MSDSFVTPWTVGSSVHRILQARILQWVAISFSNASNIRPPKCIKQILIDPKSKTDSNTITEKWEQGCLMLFSEQLGDKAPNFNRTATAGLLTVAPTEKARGGVPGSLQAHSQAGRNLRSQRAQLSHLVVVVPGEMKGLFRGHTANAHIFPNSRGASLYTCPKGLIRAAAQGPLEASLCIEKWKRQRRKRHKDGQRVGDEWSRHLRLQRPLSSQGRLGVVTGYAAWG